MADADSFQGGGEMEREPLLELGLHSAAVVPILEGERLIGALAAGSIRSHAATSPLVQSLRLVGRSSATRSSVAIRN